MLSVEIPRCSRNAYLGKDSVAFVCPQAPDFEHVKEHFLYHSTSGNDQSMRSSVDLPTRAVPFYTAPAIAVNSIRTERPNSKSL